MSVENSCEASLAALPEYFCWMWIDRLKLWGGLYLEWIKSAACKLKISVSNSEKTLSSFEVQSEYFGNFESWRVERRTLTTLRSYNLVSQYFEILFYFIFYSN